MTVWQSQVVLFNKRTQSAYVKLQFVMVQDMKIKTYVESHKGKNKKDI